MPSSSKVERALRRAESALLAGLLLAMIGVAVYQVAARNLFGYGLPWGDGMVRVALLWVTMIGAMAAAGSDEHIRVDVVTRFVGGRAARRLARLTSLFTATLCFALAWFSVTLIAWDYRDATPGFGAVPAWVCELVIPIGAGVMGLRYLMRAVTPKAPSPARARSQAPRPDAASGEGGRRTGGPAP